MQSCSLSLKIECRTLHSKWILQRWVLQLARLPRKAEEAKQAQSLALL